MQSSKDEGSGMKLQKPLVFISLLFVLAVHAEEIRLKDGTVLQGERVRLENNGHTQVIRTTTMGELWIPIDQIVKTVVTPTPHVVSSPQTETTVSQAPAKTSSPVAESNRLAEKEGVDPSGQTLVLMPTAFTPPAGTWSFKDFELLFLTLGYSPTSSTSVSVGAFFPINPSQFELFTFGIKQQLFAAPDGQSAVAVDADLITPTGENVDGDASIWTATLIGSLESQGMIGVHGAIGMMGSFKSEADGNVLTLALGTDFRLTPHAKFIAEYLRGSVTNVDGSVSAINVGFRIHGERLSADICGVRPIVEDQDFDGLFLYPLINIGYRF